MEAKFQRLKGKSITDKTMNYELVMDVINEQYGNLTGRHGETDGSYKQVTSILRAFARKICRIAMLNSQAPTFEKGWKSEFSDQTYDVLKIHKLDPLIENTIKKMYRRFPKHVRKSGMTTYAFLKIANCAGCASRMLLHGYHPDFMLSTEGETKKSLLETATRLKKLGVPVITISAP